MAAEQRRFTISVTSEMKFDLDMAKKEQYHGDTQSKMIRDLIVRGLNALKMENENKTGIREKGYENSL